MWFKMQHIPILYTVSLLPTILHSFHKRNFQPIKLPMLPTIATIFAMLQAMPPQSRKPVLERTNDLELRELINQGVLRLSRVQMQQWLMGMPQSPTKTVQRPSGPKHTQGGGVGSQPPPIQEPHPPPIQGPHPPPTRETLPPPTSETHPLPTRETQSPPKRPIMIYHHAAEGVDLEAIEQNGLPNCDNQRPSKQLKLDQSVQMGMHVQQVQEQYMALPPEMRRQLMVRAAHLGPAAFFGPVQSSQFQRQEVPATSASDHQTPRWIDVSGTLDEVDGNPSSPIVVQDGEQGGNRPPTNRFPNTAVEDTSNAQTPEPGRSTPVSDDPRAKSSTSDTEISIPEAEKDEWTEAAEESDNIDLIDPLAVDVRRSPSKDPSSDTRPRIPTKNKVVLKVNPPRRSPSLSSEPDKIQWALFIPTGNDTRGYYKSIYALSDTVRTELLIHFINTYRTEGYPTRHRLYAKFTSPSSRPIYEANGCCLNTYMYRQKEARRGNAKSYELSGGNKMRACDHCVKTEMLCARIEKVGKDYKLAFMSLPETLREKVKWDEMAFWVRR